MLNNEIYWTEEYILYAEMIEKKQAEQIAKLDRESSEKEEVSPQGEEELK